MMVLLTGCAVTNEYVDEIKNIKKTKSVDHKLCLYGCPLGADKSNFLVDHDILLLSSNRATKFSDWVAYQVRSEHLGGKSRNRNWKKDPVVPSEYTFSPSDYAGANTKCGYDRGHQAPLASFSNNSDWRITNYLSNITPQLASLNQGPWAKLESKVRDLAREKNIIYVTTGPYYTTEIMCELPNARLDHRVPNGYWKIIAMEESGALKIIGFIMPQSLERGANYCDYSASLSDISHKTGLFFFNDYQSSYGDLTKNMGC